MKQRFIASLTMLVLLVGMHTAAVAKGIVEVGATDVILPSTYYSNEDWTAWVYNINNGLFLWWGQEVDCLGTPPNDRYGREWYNTRYSRTNSQNISWEQATAPFHSDEYYNGLPSFMWTEPNVAADIYILRTFTVDSKLPETVYLACGHDDGESQFYINGTLVHSTDTYWNEAEYILLSDEQKALIKTDGSQNILALHVHNNYGGAFADCGIYAVPDNAKGIGNLSMGFITPWTARVMFNNDGGYAYDYTNIESSIHGWEKLYEAQPGDTYTIHTTTQQTRVELNTPITLLSSHAYRISATLLSDKEATVWTIVEESAGSEAYNDISSYKTLQPGSPVSMNIAIPQGTAIDDLSLMMNIETESGNAAVQLSDISVFDVTEGEELWTGTSYYFWAYSEDSNGNRVKDPVIEGRKETLSWTWADYDDSMWKELLMPVGNAGYIPELQSIWPGGENSNYWIRRDFTLDEVKATSRYTIQVCHDDNYSIYVNGHLIASALGWTDGKNYERIEVPSRFLKKGNNVIATYIQQNWGGKFFDCGMSVEPDVYEEGDLEADVTTSLIATEVHVANIDQTIDYSFNYGAWLELYNNSEYRVSLDYLYVSDDAQDLKKFILPAYGVVKPHDYKCIFFDHNSADGTYGPTANRQVPFKLNTEGGTLYLSQDGVNPFLTVSYPAAITRCSWARKNLIGDEWGYNGDPTPAAPNADCFATERLLAPVVDTDSRLFTSPFSVNVEIPAGATLRYTLDGTTPTLHNGTTSTSGRFSISATTNLRLRLFEDGMLPSPVVTRSYIFDDMGYYLPVISITTDSENLYGDSIGVYVDGVNGVEGRNHGKSNVNMDWERPVNFEYITPDGKMVINQEAEFCISGGWSRHFAPSSFKLKATKLYEGVNSFDYPFFARNPYKKFKQLLIRNGGNDNDSWSHGRVRDAITQEVLTSNGFYVDAQAYQPTHVFFNGQYIGMLNLREPNNKYNGTASYGYDDDEMDAFEYSNGYFQMAGTKDAFDRWHSLALNAEDDDTYDEICQLVDIDEVINYFAAITYIGCTDWICNNNNSKGYRTLPDGKFHLTVLDQDWGWGNQQALTTLSSYNGNELAQIFNGMRRNPRFQRQFVDAYCLLAGSVFTPERCTAIGDSICSLVEEALSFEDKQPYTSYEEQKYNMTSTNSRSQRQLSLRNVFKLGYGMSAKFGANIPQASFMLNNQPVPGGRFEGRLYAPVTITASAPAGYVFEGWASEGGDVTDNIFDYESEWQYYDEGSLDDYDWKEPNCDFTDWKNGFTPIGYNGRGEASIITETTKFLTAYYFRKTFYLSEEPASDTKFRINLGSDDGYIIYINGQEAARYLMPAGDVTYETVAVTHAPDPFYQTSMLLDASLFRKGENVIAVEVHNNVPTSSDIYWAAELSMSGTGYSIVSTDNQLTIDEDNDFALTAMFRRIGSDTPVRINEVSAGNDIYASEYFKRDDWMELYNTTDHDIDIAGMFLSDNLSKPQKYEIQPADGISTIIPANGTLIVWADKRQQVSQLHAPFKLDNADGSVLTLQAADGSWTDVLRYNEHDSKETFGRYPDGGNTAYTMSIPTIDRSNVLSSYDFILDDLYHKDEQITNTFALEKGWNWTSHNLQETIETALYKSQNSIIRSQTNELYRDENLDWVGSVPTLNAALGFKVKADVSHDVVLSGHLYDTARPVSVSKGWNWIGCPLAKTTVLSSALSDFNASEGDEVVGIQGFAVYSDGQWHGNLTSLSPGQAYMLKSTQPQVFCWNSLTTSNKAHRRYAPAINEADGPWETDIHAYSDIMNIIATLHMDGTPVTDSGSYWVAAFAGDECRGLGQMEDGKLFLTIHGDTNVPICFRVMDASGEEYGTLESTTFQPLQLLGSMASPFVLNIGEATDIVHPSQSGRPVHTMYYTLGGQALAKPASGVIIQKTFYDDGNIVVKKVLK